MVLFECGDVGGGDVDVDGRLCASGEAPSLDAALARVYLTYRRLAMFVR